MPLVTRVSSHSAGCFGIQDLEKRGLFKGPNVSVAVIHGTCSSQRINFVTNIFDIVLTTYQTFNARYRGSSIPLKYHRVFCDEAHGLRTKCSSAVTQAVFDSIWFVTGTPIVLQAEDLNPLLEYFKLKMPKETFRSLLTTNANVFGQERARALAILKPVDALCCHFYFKIFIFIFNRRFLFFTRPTPSLGAFLYLATLAVKSLQSASLRVKGDV
jgi:hypothetical protein